MTPQPPEPGGCFLSEPPEESSLARGARPTADGTGFYRATKDIAKLADRRFST